MLARSSWVLAAMDAVPLADLAGISFVDGPPGYGNRTVVNDAFAAADIERTPAPEVADIGTAATYIRNGPGIGLLSYVATSSTRPPSAATGAPLSLIEEAISA